VALRRRSVNRGTTIFWVVLTLAILLPPLTAAASWVAVWLAFRRIQGHLQVVMQDEVRKQDDRIRKRITAEAPRKEPDSEDQALQELFKGDSVQEVVPYAPGESVYS